MRKYVLAIVGLVLACLVAALGTASGSPDTITVDSTTDVLDADGSCDLVDIADLPGTDSKTSLREAICAANNNSGSDTIAFNIPVTDTGYQVSGITGTWTISLTSALPTLYDGGTIISGTTQAANQGDLNLYGPEIEISGASLSDGDCLFINSANNVVHGLVINRCPDAGVLIRNSGSDYNTVSGNYIGTDASGSSDLGNKIGVDISYSPQGNMVGGDTPEERNVISGNDQYGVHIAHSAHGNTVSGNYIGTDATGAQDVGNAGWGVNIDYGSQNNTIGGDTQGERNVISANSTGVSIARAGTMSNTVSGNYIGTDVTGSFDLGNTGTGVSIQLQAQHNTVGGQTTGERNVISANQRGVMIGGLSTMSNTVSGNYIGTDVTGSSDLGNAVRGIEITTGAQHNVVGGQTAGERNIISGNNGKGVHINGYGADNNTVSGNYIGTDATGTQDLGNNSEGVRIDDHAQDNTVGGQTAGERNVISGNGHYGVLIWGSGADGNVVSGNYIGTDAAGTQELGNSYDGVRIEGGAGNNIIGGQSAAERNIISGNNWKGVHITGSGTDGNTVSYNYIGTDVTATQDKGNAHSGVKIRNGAQDNTVGPNNVIGHNDMQGVSVGDSGTTGNTITENSIHSNGSLGIDLASGGNDDIPAPTVGYVGGCFGTVSGTAGAGDTVEVFTGPDDEGKTYLATDVADGSGDWEISGSFSFDTYVTATATDGSGNTSEFSAEVEVVCYQAFLPFGVRRY
jgi:titin